MNVVLLLLLMVHVSAGATAFANYKWGKRDAMVCLTGYLGGTAVGLTILVLMMARALEEIWG